MDIPQDKACSRCTEVKPLAQFYRCAMNADGLQKWCVACRKAQRAATRSDRNAKERAKYAADPTAVLDYQKQWRKANVEKANAICRRWREAHPEQQRASNSASQARQYAADPAKFLAKCATYRARRPDVVWLQRMRRHATRWRVEVFTGTYADWLEILEEHAHSCAYCGRDGLKLLTEHRIPFARGGQHVRENIVPACHSCNVRKCQLTDTEFREVQARRQAA